jgi:hypothetical protein
MSDRIVLTPTVAKAIKSVTKPEGRKKMSSDCNRTKAYTYAGTWVVRAAQGRKVTFEVVVEDTSGTPESQLLAAIFGREHGPTKRLHVSVTGFGSVHTIDLPQDSPRLLRYKTRELMRLRSMLLRAADNEKVHARTRTSLKTRADWIAQHLDLNAVDRLGGIA